MDDEERAELERLRRRTAELERTAEGYRLLVETTGVVLWEVDAATLQYTYVSPKAVELFGHTVQAWLQPNFWVEHLHPDDRDWAVDYCRTEVRARADHTFDYRFRCADGSYAWVRDMVSVVLGADGQPVSLRGVFLDITEERRQRAEREQWIRVFEYAEWGMAIADAATRRFVMVNPAFLRMHQLEDSSTLIGAPVTSLYPDPEIPRIQAFMDQVDAHGHGTFESQHLRADGTPFPVRVTSSVVRDRDGHVNWRAAHVVDMTDRVAERERTLELEEQLRQSQKLEAVGLLASGIAHDFNNHLTVILGCSELLRESVKDDALVGLARSITSASNAAAQVTNQLLAFAREQPREPRGLDLNRYLAATADLLDRLLPEDIELVADLADGPLPVKADPAQIEQVVLNLALNARDAMAKAGGRLTLRTQLDNPRAILDITDTGTGMPPEIRERIFEPFFSTKPTVKGTGLGLATVHGIVEQNGWEIRVESELGQGTSFRLWLPLATDQPVTKPSGETPGESRPVRVLVAEDDDAVAEVVCRSLSAAGHEVLRAVDGVEALDLLANQGLFDLLLSDVMMPRMRGGELLRNVRELYPSLPVLFMSGYASDELVASGERLLPKPFTPARLLSVVQEVLAGD